MDDRWFGKCGHPSAISPGFGPRLFASEHILDAHDGSVHAFLVACGVLDADAPLSVTALAHEIRTKILSF